jgi:hypothetical protein
MKLCTQPHRFRTKPERGNQYSIQNIVDAAITHIDSYAEKGFTPTLRQLFYRLVAVQILLNRKADYRNLGRYINFAKGAGIIDWDAVEDRTRYVRGRNRYLSTKQWLEASLNEWHMDFWVGQLDRPEIWIEKDALLGIIKPVCDKYDVRFYSLRGWGRPADNFSSAQRFLVDFNSEPARLTNIIFHLGDYDPTGCAVTPQIEDAVKGYARQLRAKDDGNNSDAFVDVRRIGLTKAQIDKYNLAPNRIGDETDEAVAAKEDKKGNESRLKAYLGANDGCPDTWELDALDPVRLQAIVEDAIKSCINNGDAWAKRQRLIQSRARRIRTLVRKLGGAEVESITGLAAPYDGQQGNCEKANEIEVC